MADEGSQAPPKPLGEPDIELLPVRPMVIKVEVDPETGVSDIAGAMSGYFSFAAVSGYDSYTANLVRSSRDGDEIRTLWTEGRVESGSVYFSRGGDGVDPYEFVIGEGDTFWTRDDGVWSLDLEGGEGFLFEVVILADWQHSLLYETFETLTFSDWDLIDGVWYARYAASREFAAAVTSRWPLSDDTAIVAGDVWVSPQGYMHSYSVSVEKTDSGQIEETKWALSDLGSTSIDLPDSGEVSPSTTTTEALPAIGMLEELLASESWDPRLVLEAEPFRWRGRSLLYFVDLDPSDNAGYAGEEATLAVWGSVGAGGIERQQMAGFNVDTGKGGEFVQFDGTLSSRLGTFDINDVFEPDDEGWLSREVEATVSQVAAGLFLSGYRLYNNYEPPALEVVGVADVAGVPAVRLRSIVSAGGDPGFRFNATFDFWIDGRLSEPRILRMTYVADWERDMYVDGVVTGREIAEKSLEVYDIGDTTIVIDSP